MSNVQLFPVGSYRGPGAEIVAHDPTTQRLFVISGGTELQVLDIRNPSRPTKVGTLDVSAYGAGANSVAIKNGLVAIAVEGNEKTDPGSVVFLDANANVLKVVTVGALPDMITFTPDGSKVLTANEGEPNDSYTVDPEGSVSIIDLSNGVANATVNTADFRAFNSRKVELQNQGVRIFGPNATVAQDLEPEYITVSADGKTAWVTLQENNAIAIVDVATATVRNVVPLGFKDHSKGLPTLTTYEFTDLPTLGTTAPSPNFANGQEIKLGGFSGLFFEGYAANGNLKFITHPDRGPNGEPTNLIPGIPGNERPFILPDFQPELVRFELNPTTGQLTFTQRIGLTTQDGTPLTGLPNLQAGVSGSAYTDETPIDLFGNLLGNDPLGADLEGIVVAPDGSFWMVDEYRPAIYHFDATGKLINRFVPEGTAAAVGAAVGTFGVEALPAVYAQRRANRGFEAVALDGNKLYAFIQSPIDNPDTTNDATSRASKNVRILELDITTGEVTGEYLYALRDISGSGTARTDKIGDAVALGNGKFLVAERDDRTTRDANKLVFEINLTGATNLQDVTLPAGATIETLSLDQLAEYGVQAVSKRLVTNLGPLGYTGVSKLEGLALIDANTIAVINDNDFGLQPAPIPGDGTALLSSDPEPILLGLVNFNQGNGLDASDRDGGINIRNWPVLGMYQPDAIASYEANGQTYLITANEGDARAYDGFNEEVRINELRLDPTVFPNARDLLRNTALGRLRATNTLGDLDGDGDYDELYAYGGRSFSIWDASGNLVFDSGDQLEQLTASLFPEAFNSNQGIPASASFDTRSDDKGPEPEGLTLGEVNGHTYAFVGLERIGGVVVYDVSDPLAPVFVQYINYSSSFGFAPGLDRGPEGLLFISAEDSPTGNPTLVVSNEISGTVTLFEIAVPTQGTAGDDRLVTGNGRDFITAGAGNDLVAGGLGDDVIYGEAGDDVLRGDRNSTASGSRQDGNDIIYGGDGNDQIAGKGGDDSLYGDNGDDQLWGDGGDDLLWGGLGNDTLRGGQGEDTFVLQPAGGTDLFLDFNPAQDKIGLTGGLTIANLSFSKQGLGTVVRNGDDVLAIINRVRPNVLMAAQDTVFITL